MARGRILGVALVCVVFVGCVAHEKNGDRAAALGDWRAAYSEYREALALDPESKDLKGKFDGARKEAIAESLRRANAALAVANFENALAEASYVVELDPGNVEAATLRASAAKAAAKVRIDSARALAKRGQVEAGFAELRRGLQLSNAPEFESEVAEIRTLLVAGAVDAAAAARASKDYPQALRFLELAVSADGTKAGLLAEVRAELEAWQIAEHARLSALGDGEVAGRQWAQAEQHYRDALAFREQSETIHKITYVQAVRSGEDAVRRRDFGGAATSFRRAIDSTADASGYAASQLEIVEVRPYAIRLRTLMVKPHTPSGDAWVGPKDPLFKTALTLFAGVAGAALVPTGGAAIGKQLAEAYNKVPPKNRPDLWIEATLPDGRQATTPKVKALYAAYDSEMTIASNQLDERVLHLRVLGMGDVLNDVGVFDVPLRDLVAKRKFVGSTESVVALEVFVEPAPNRVDGMLTEMSVQISDDNAVSAYSGAQPGRAGYRLVNVSTQIVRGDYGDELGMDGAPDPSVEIEQGGKVIYRAPFLQDRYEASWRPQSTFVFLDPSETVIVRLIDRDASQDDLVMNFRVSAQDVASGQVRLRTRNGSDLRLVFEQRPEGPQ